MKADFVSAIHLDIFHILDQVLRGPRWGATLRLAFPSDSFAATRLFANRAPMLSRGNEVG